MPCRSDYPEENYEAVRLRTELDKVTAIACEALSIIEGTVSFDRVDVKPTTLEWWNNHKEFDRKRKQKVMGKLRDAKKQLSILLKLSTAERRTLGIQDQVVNLRRHVRQLKAQLD